jgi:adenosine kinase
MLQVPDATTYVGCIGKDHFGEVLTKAAEGDGVKVQYLVDETTPTGTCAVLITDKERSLVANLGAAQKFKFSHLTTPALQESIEKAKIFYTTGYFVIVTPEGVIHLGKHAAEHNKIFVLNISAPFIVDFFFDQLSSVIPYADYVIANESEAQAFGKKNGWGEDLQEIAHKLSALPKENGKRKRTVVFTQGADATIVFDGTQLHQFKPSKIDASLIVDTNGAGDTFAGGFLSQLVQNKPLETCVAAGHYCAGLCIQTSGCKFSGKPNFA